MSKYLFYERIISCKSFHPTRFANCRSILVLDLFQENVLLKITVISERLFTRFPKSQTFVQFIFALLDLLENSVNSGGCICNMMK